MDEPVRTDLPRGFRGSVDGWHDIVPGGARNVLRLPLQAEQDGRFLRIPEGPFDGIFVESVVEGFGNFEAFVAELASRLAPGGRLWIDADHENGPHVLRRVLEGKGNSLDPPGSYWMPEIALDPRRLVAACENAGLVATDLVRLPHAETFRPAFVRSLIEQGFMASNLAGGDAPSARLWLCAEKTRSDEDARGGTVVIGPGSEAAQSTTRSCIEAFLPSDWTVDVSTERRELLAFNRGFARSRGDTVWFLRAGSQPSGQAFEALCCAAALAPAVPGDADHGPATPGDLNGLMARRSDVLCIGPLDEAWNHDFAAYEEFAMRADARGLFLLHAGGPFDAPRLEFPAVEVVQAESDRLFERWSGISDHANTDGAVSVDAVAGDTRPNVPWAGRTPRVSLCMIARDEERFLDECLRRAAPAVDEIIVVDTGSKDRTIEIARAHGATVIEEEWVDDFARPRNTGLEAATGDWVLVLDADEYLDEGSAEAIRRLVKSEKTCGYHVRFTNVFDEQKTLGVTMVRLFRRLPNLSWCNRIHEQVTPSLLEHAAPLDLVLMPALDVHVLHYGYQPEVMDSRGKLERNERLFKLQLAEHPDDIYSLYKYGDFLRRCPGRDDESIAVLERTFELILEKHPATPRGVPYAGEVAALCALEAARRDDYDRAAYIVETALRRFMATPNLHYIAASLALRLGHEDAAIAHYERCLAYRGQTLVVPIQDGITGHVSMTGMAQALLQKGDRPAARRMLERAIALDPSHDVSAMVLSRLWLEEGDIRRSLGVLTDYLASYPDSAGVCQQASMLLARLGLNDQAKRIGERAIALLEADASEIEANHMRKTLAALG